MSILRKCGIGAACLCAGVVGLATPWTISVLHADLQNKECVTVGPGSPHRASFCLPRPDCTASPDNEEDLWCRYTFWSDKKGAAIGDSAVLTYETCVDAENKYCEVDWTNSDCVTWVVYSGYDASLPPDLQCFDPLCDKAIEMDDCHTDTFPYWP